MKKLAIALLVGAAFAPVVAMADAGDIIARFRAINVNPDVSTTSTLSDLSTDVKDATVPELDFTYMITNNIGAELILGTSRHKVSADLGNGSTSLGKVSVLPPTLTLQWHFMPQSEVFRPYVGAGINYTRFYDVGLRAGASKLTVDKNSWGGALQVGADFPISKNVFLNVDVKKLWISTDVHMDGVGKLGTLDINPWVFGLGVGMKF
ncbi:OmpW family outer membrane protein [Microvirgula aerodenitrificans]|uniref:OmpW/AlkL family protein n=1 Tax=Microvirgula aerodenitrificans TaxID=57480 RepID=UPI0028E2A610|nr:OmpW family outer membrane protein [Microvirgula aerodenitrificans]